MSYNFDEIIERRNTSCVKYDATPEVFGTADLLPMWVADMDFRTPDFILKAIEERLKHPILGYFFHDDEFHQTIINWMQKRHNWCIEKEWISFSPGIVTGLATIVQAFTEKGDKVIVQPPVYHPFYYVIKNQERIVVPNPLKLEGDRYKMDFEDLEKRVKEGAKMLILCNPHNPVGRCWKPEELERLGELCLNYHCLVVSDEIHADMVMPGYRHYPMAKISKSVSNNTVTCMAPSKTFNIAGLSTSEIIISNPKLREQFNQWNSERLHLQMGNIFGDVALKAAYTYGEEWLEQLMQYIEKNVLYVKQFLKNYIPQIKTFEHEASYILWMDFNALNLSHDKLNQILIHDLKLGFNDGMIFGDEGRGFMRINLACPKSTIIEAMKRLKRIVEIK